MRQMGAKDDVGIFERGEWWRIFTCNWLHVGLFHLLFNMLAVLSLGIGLERRFGSARIGALYVLSGLFGTMVSVVLLPGVLSLGASASVFGLVGATWADVILNYLARGTIRNSGFISLLFLTVINLLVGLTPYAIPYLSSYLSICQSIYLSISIDRSTDRHNCVSACLSICLSIYSLLAHPLAARLTINPPTVHFCVQVRRQFHAHRWAVLWPHRGPGSLHQEACQPQDAPADLHARAEKPRRRGSRRIRGAPPFETSKRSP